jgi:hypothetical protein
MTMAKNKVVFVIFVLSLVLAAPSILKILKGDFKASQLFSDNPFQNLIKSVVLRNYPESKVVEERLEQLIPESSVNVSISTLYAQGGKSTNLNISVISDSKLSESQVESVKASVCDTLGTKTSKYSNIKMSVSDLKFNSTNTFSTDIKCT